MNKSFLIALTLGAAVLAPLPAAIAAPAASVQSGSYTVEPSHTRIQFAVDHMGFTNFYGDFTGATGALELNTKAPALSKVDISIPVSSVSTTNTKLDGELVSAAWLDAGSYPTIKFVSDHVVPAGKDHAKVFGTLTLHGVSRPVVLDTQFHGAGTNPLAKSYTVGFDATTQIMRSDFGVKTYLPLIGDAVTIRISAAFERKPA
jgi:polyisoprenoid-binding protein YceI